MTATERMTGTTAMAGVSSSKTPWMVAAIIVLAVVAAVFAGLWLVERNDMSAAEADLETTTEALATSEAEVVALQSEISGLEAEVTALTPETTVSHELHAQTRALYEDFTAALEDPQAAEISAMFAPYASHTSAMGLTTFGAEEIGLGWEQYGSLTVDDPGALIVNGDTGYVKAAMTGAVNGVDGLLVARVGPAPGDANRLVFYDMVWYNG